MHDNPYQSPPSDEPLESTAKQRERAASAVRIPAAIVILLCILSIVFNLIVISGVLFRSNTINDNLLVIAVHVFTIFGAVHMLRLRSLWFARAAMIVCMVPIFSPLICLGIPAGFGGLMLLRRPHVKAAFRQ